MLCEAGNGREKTNEPLAMNKRFEEGKYSRRYPFNERRSWSEWEKKGARYSGGACGTGKDEGRQMKSSTTPA